MTIGSEAYADIQIEGLNEDWKNVHRLTTYTYLMNHVDVTRPLTFLGLPGTGWNVEHELISTLPNGIMCVGCEIMKKLIPHSLDNMPGEGLQRKILRLTDGRRIEYWETDTAVLFRRRMSEVLALRSSDFIKPVESVEFYSKFGRADLIWVDGVGHLCPDTRKMLSNIHKMMNTDVEYIPAVFTISTVRATRGEPLDESIEDVKARRIAKFREMLKECCPLHDVVDFHVDDHKSYKTRMINLQFLFKLKG